MRLSDLRAKRVKTLDGDMIGRVHEVHCDGGRIVALMVGAPSLIERMTSKAHGKRVRWEDVVRVDDDAVVIAPSASRSRQGTRRPSAPRLKR